jgi:XTP/dITP diphosphohydrolase
MMRRLLIATTSEGKGRELRQRLSEGWEVVTLRDSFKIWGQWPDVEESGETFLDNARLKAARYSLWAAGEWVVADDSGLCVDALGGEPGVLSARYAGEPRDDGKNMARVLEKMRGKKNRRATFYCALVLARNGSSVAEMEGRCSGTLAEEARGSNGFGYDPIFIPEGYDKSFGELPLEVKARLSHRAKALDGLVEVLKNIG